MNQTIKPQFNNQSKAEYWRKYKKTKSAIVGIIYSKQKARSKIRGHTPPEYTKEELREWLFSQPLFHSLHSEWVESGCLRKLKPSVNRKKDDIGYSMINIELMTWGENDHKADNDRRLGKLNSAFPHRPVKQYNSKGKLIKEYISVSEATRQTGITNICKCCKGRSRTAGGFIWKYA